MHGPNLVIFENFVADSPKSKLIKGAISKDPTATKTRIPNNNRQSYIKQMSSIMKFNLLNDLYNNAYATSYAAYDVAIEAASAIRKGFQDAAITVQNAKLDAVAAEATGHIIGGVKTAAGTVNTAARNAVRAAIMGGKYTTEELTEELTEENEEPGFKQETVVLE